MVVMRMKIYKLEIIEGINKYFAEAEGDKGEFISVEGKTLKSALRKLADSLYNNAKNDFEIKER